MALRSDPRQRNYLGYLRQHLANLSPVCLALRRPDEAAAAARESTAIGGKQPVGLYNGACLLSRCAAVASGTTESAGYADEAFAALRAAVAAGWRDGLIMARDPDLTPLRDRDDFRRLVVELLDRAMPAYPFAP
jgi:hypothetical protein